MSFFINDVMAQAAPAAGASPQGGLMGLIFPIGLVLILYFFMIRPQVKRQKAHKALVEGLAKGDEVQTIGGLMGKIKSVGENFVKIEIGDGMVVTVRRSAVESVMPKGTLKDL